jgi:voltage-gated potassium channel Kch
MIRRNLFFGKIDLIVAIIGFISGFIVISLYLISATIYLLTFGFAIFLASLVYLLIRNKKENEYKYYIKKKEKFLYEIFFLIFFSTSLYILSISEGRPPIYFIIISVCAGLLAISIFYSETKSDSRIQILKIFMLSFNIKCSIYYFYDGIPGIDSVTHAKMNDILSQAGNINVLVGKELYFPIMHINVAITKILTNVNIKDASFFAVIIPFVISTIFLFLFAKEFFGEKIGLLAMLIVNITDFHIYWGSAPQTTSFGIIIYFFILFAFSKVINEKNNIKWHSISLILIPIMILTHAVSSFIFDITSIGILIGSIMYRVLFNKSDKKLFLETLTLITSILLLQYWFIALYNQSRSTFFDTIVLTLDYYITRYASFLSRPESSAEYASAYLPPLIERLANTSGLAILIFFSVVGSLFWLSSKYRNKLNFSLVICIILLLGITLVFPFFGLHNIMSNRWFAFEYFILSILASFSIVKISQLYKKSYSTKIFIIITFASLTFFMSSSTISNLDSPIWLKKSTVSTSHTFKEVSGDETLLKYSNNNLVIDDKSGSVLNDPDYFKSENDLFNSKNKIFIWRKYSLDRPIQYVMTIKGYSRPVIENKILGHSFLEKLERFDKLYSNSDISGYYITS